MRSVWSDSKRLPKVLIYDGGCSFCRKNVAVLEKILGLHLNKVSYRDSALMQSYPEVPLSFCEKGAVLLLEDGSILTGAAVFFELLALRPFFSPLKRLYHIPRVQKLIDRVYERVAQSRYKL